MSKSVYSLVLSDDVVEAVDHAAHRAGLSRSAFINNVLAEAVSFTTPEKRINDIFAEIEQLMSGDIFRIMPRPSETAVAMRSALRYKYNPVINYSIELYSDTGNTFGKLKVTLRTTSQDLIAAFSDFIRILAEAERNLLSSRITGNITYTFENGKFIRAFCYPSGGNPLTDRQTAAALSGYVRLFDELVKIYFANTDDIRTAERLIKQRYMQHIKDGNTII